MPDETVLDSVKKQGLEGIVAKRRDSKCEPDERSGAWQKMRVNRSPEFVIGGYTLGGRHFDALIFGYWEGNRLMYAQEGRPNKFQSHRHDEVLQGDRFESLIKSAP